MSTPPIAIGACNGHTAFRQRISAKARLVHGISSEAPARQDYTRQAGEDPGVFLLRNGCLNDIQHYVNKEGIK